MVSKITLVRACSSVIADPIKAKYLTYKMLDQRYWNSSIPTPIVSNHKGSTRFGVEWDIAWKQVNEAKILLSSSVDDSHNK